MGFIRPSVLLFALVMTTPAMYRFAFDELDITSVLARFLIAVPIAALLLAGLRYVTSGYGRSRDPAVPATSKPLDTDSAAHSS